MESEPNQLQDGSAVHPENGNTVSTTGDWLAAYVREKAKPVTSEDFLPLTDADLKYFDDRAVSREIVKARGAVRISGMTANKLGYTGESKHLSGVLWSLYGVTGDDVKHQLKRDVPVIDENGKPQTYVVRSRALQEPGLDVLPSHKSKLLDVTVPVLYTESIPKADSATSGWGDQIVAVGQVGCWGFSSDGAPLPDFEEIKHKSKSKGAVKRKEYIAPDSDVATNPGVWTAVDRQRRLLERRGADVSVIVLPPNDAGGKNGLDDWRAANPTATLEDLLKLAVKDVPRPGGDSRYSASERGISFTKHTMAGPVDVLLTNFEAVLTANIRRDDGVETKQHVEITARVDGRTINCVIPSSEFAGMSWAFEKLGPSAIISAGNGTRDQVREAIQRLSSGIEERHIYTHTGWREINGVWCYLHAGGAIGATRAIQVELPPQLAAFVLPEPPQDDALKAAIRKTLALLDGLGSDRVMMPIVSSIWRSVAGYQSSFGLHVTGATGLFKSELAALSQQHFGAGFDARHLPGSWSSTANAIEGQAFVAKDSLFVIDDLVLPGSKTDRDRQLRDVDRLFRGAGNGSGRARMRADTTLRPTKSPRALLFSTGEELPAGESLRARVLIVEVAQGDIDTDRLTECQQDANDGAYALAMSGYLGWLGPQLSERIKQTKGKAANYRAEAVKAGQHARTPGTVAELFAGLESYLDFAVEVGAIEHEKRSKLLRRAWDALIGLGFAQAAHQHTQEPAMRFMELVSSAISAGRAYVADDKGAEPPDSAAWGWDCDQSGLSRARGMCVGWLDGNGVYLDPVSSYKAATEMTTDGAGIGATAETLRKRLYEKGLLISTELATRQRYTIRKSLAGSRRPVLHLAHTSFGRVVKETKDGKF